MKVLLQDEYEDFIKSYQSEQSYGLRLNELKTTRKGFLRKQPFTLREIPWIKNGFYYDKTDRPGKHPYHDAGVYYIQDPSAMAVVELMDPKPGEKILDIAAAPGGKATQIATKMNGKGLLIANDIHSKRAHILSENIERLGITNTVVTNEHPKRLSEHLPRYFDRILVDAPCSGEGMFRKNPEAYSEWSLANVEQCASRQIDILQAAHEMLRDGGQLVYATCTFSPEENEQIIEQFIQMHPTYEIERKKTYEKFAHGQTAWMTTPDQSIENTIRIWPHHVEGEGHFIAFLRKKDDKPSPRLQMIKQHSVDRNLQYYRHFVKQFLKKIPKGLFTFFGDHLYIVPDEMIDMKGLRILRAGWHLGVNKRNRFEPSHALALSLQPRDVMLTYDLSSDSEDVIKYLKGETFPASGSKGWYMISVDGYSLGWGKLVNGMMKNHYPRGLRWFDG